MRRSLRLPAILVYHGVGEVDSSSDPARLVAGPQTLGSHLNWLGRRGYRFSSAAELAGSVSGDGPPAGTAILTFDDGLVDGLSTVAPLLRDRGIPATFFICPGLLGGQHEFIEGVAGRLLSADQARELDAMGFDLGAHSMTHPDLRALDDAKLTREIRESKEGVEELTGKPCRTFAHPYGLSDGRVQRAVEAAGFEIAFAWGPGRWSQFAAPRLPAPIHHGGRRLGLKLLASRSSSMRARPS
jgi:peptidoglycan/xylan/chitin deacetylase (PgdA/CDA1 family)